MKKHMQYILLLNIGLATLYTSCNSHVINEKPKEDTLAEVNLLNIEKIIPRFPYKSLTHFRITDTLKLTEEIDTILFRQIYQGFIKKPAGKWSECGCPLPEWARKGKDYLLSYQGQEIQSNFPFDVITTYSKYDAVETIYLLGFAARNQNDKEKEQGSMIFKKGSITKFYLGPVLAMKYSNDTTTVEMYSTIDTLSNFTRTTVTRYNKKKQTDSLIEIFGTCLYDQSVLMGDKKYTNDRLIYDNTVEEGL